jgi:hypothetical protein
MVAAIGRGDLRLFQSPWPPAGIWAHRAVDSAEALKGLRIRTADANGVVAFRAAGAVPVAVSFTDALPRLRAGQLDAVLSSGDGGAGQRLMERTATPGAPWIRPSSRRCGRRGWRPRRGSSR